MTAREAIFLTLLWELSIAGIYCVVMTVPQPLPLSWPYIVDIAVLLLFCALLAVSFVVGPLLISELFKHPKKEDA